MSKSIGRVFGTGAMSPYGYETDYMQYLRGYNPYNYEQTLQNMMPSAVNVNVLPDYRLSMQNSASQPEETVNTFNEKPEDTAIKQWRELKNLVDRLNQMNAYKDGMYSPYNGYGNSISDYNLTPDMQESDYSLELPEFDNSRNYCIAENNNITTDVLMSSDNNRKVDFDDIYYSKYDENGNRIYKGIADEEGEYSDRSVDTPTNYGVTQAALDEYNAWNSPLRTMYNLPTDVKYLHARQAKNIMDEMYHKRYSVDKIQKLPIAANVTDHVINGGTDAGWLLADTVNNYKQLSYPRNVVISDKLAAEINNLQDDEIIPFNDLYTQRRMDRYFGVIDSKPEKINNLNGWYDRIKKFHSSQDEFDRLYKSKKEDYFRKYKSFYTGK